MDFVETLTLKLPDLSEDTTIQEAAVGATRGLLVDFAAIHAGVTENFNNYTERTLRRALKSWTDPYPKPLIMNHDMQSEPIGRVVKARMNKEEDGTPFVSLQAAITDNEAVEKVLDGRYLTASVGGKALKATCSICEADWAKASLFDIPCEHRRGRKYEGQLATIDMQEVAFRELSVVNTPADSGATIRSVQPATEDDLKKAREAAVYHIDAQAEQLTNLSESTTAAPTSFMGSEVAELLKYARVIAEAHDDQDARAFRVQQVREAALEHPMSDGDCRVCENTAGTKKDGPYGKTNYADPGYQSDGKPRYPIDSADHVRAAWSYINMPKNAQKYSSNQVSRIKSRIKKAAKQYGVKLDTDDEATMSQSFQQPEDTDDDILAAVSSLGQTSTGESEEETSEEEPEPAASEDESSEESDEDTEDTEPSEDEDPDPEEESDETSEGDEEESDEVSDEEPVADSDEDTDSEEDEDSDEDTEPAASSDADSDSEDDTEASDDDSEESDLDTAADDQTIEELRAQLDNLQQENSKLRSALKRMLAERVVDAKVSLGIVPGEDYQEQVENHINRSASSLADTLQDLATWPAPTQPQSAASGQIPPHEEGPAPTSDSKDGNVTTIGGGEASSAERQKSTSEQAVENLTGLLSNRIPTRN